MPRHVHWPPQRARGYKSEARERLDGSRQFVLLTNSITLGDEAGGPPRLRPRNPTPRLRLSRFATASRAPRSCPGRVAGTAARRLIACATRRSHHAMKHEHVRNAEARGEAGRCRQRLPVSERRALSAKPSV
jgi:hypothetical protein